MKPRDTVPKFLLQSLCLRDHGLLISTPRSLGTTLELFNRHSNRVCQFIRLRHHRVNLTMCVLRIRIVREVIQGPIMQRIETSHIRIQRINRSRNFRALTHELSCLKKTQVKQNEKNERGRYLSEKIT